MKQQPSTNTLSQFLTALFPTQPQAHVLQRLPLQLLLGQDCFPLIHFVFWLCSGKTSLRLTLPFFSILGAVVLRLIPRTGEAA